MDVLAGIGQSGPLTLLDAIMDGKLAATYAAQVGEAATRVGLPASSEAVFLEALGGGGDPGALGGAPGLTSATLEAASDTRRHPYAKAYNLAWASIVPFVVLAFVALAGVEGVGELLTERVEATVEKAGVGEKDDGV